MGKEEQFQPAPLTPVAVKPLGRKSVTVTVPAVAIFPVLLTVMVYVPVCPTVNGSGLWVLVMASTGAVMCVRSLAGSFSVLSSPPPLTFAKFVTEGPPPPFTLTVTVIAGELLAVPERQNACNRRRRWAAPNSSSLYP